VAFGKSGENPLALCEEFVRTTCPKCGKPARRETDTMDTFVDSSWYFLRYLSPRDEGRPFDSDRVKTWMPVNQYIGGIEHATMHLIYCRFFTMALQDLGLVAFDEPVANLFCQGMVCKTAHFCPQCKWLPEEKVRDGVCVTCGQSVRSEMTKMSKTKLNTVSPDKVFETFGADTLRLYIISDSPPDRDSCWSDEALAGAGRLVHRVWDMADRAADELGGVQPYDGDGSGLTPESVALWRKTHQTIRKVTEHIDSFRLNTAVAAINELVNEIRSGAEGQDWRHPAVRRLAIESLLLLLSPAIPHTAEELWERLGHRESLLRTPWPAWDERGLVSETVELPVQVNGKIRGHIVVAAGAPEDVIRAQALADEKVQKFLAGKTPRKVVVVPGRMVSLVV
jgi:leucyl-tRNA synthetase